MAGTIQDYSVSSPTVGFPYGLDQPAAAGGIFNKLVDFPGNEVIFVGRVTDVSTHTCSCVVTVPLYDSGVGTSCIWASSSLNRFGGAADFNPPQVGSLVAVYYTRAANYGIVLGQVPGRYMDPVEPGFGPIDPGGHVSSFTPDAGQRVDDLKIAEHHINGWQKQPADAFPGERGFFNELGVVVAALRTMACLKGSEMAKVEAFAVDDLLKLTAKSFDLISGAGDLTCRDDMGRTNVDWGIAASHAESVASGGVPIWRLVGLAGHQGCMRREVVAIPLDPAGSRLVGVSEKWDDSSGLSTSRSISGLGMVKCKAISVPRKVRDSDDPAGSASPNPPPPDLIGLAGFEFTDKGDGALQVRDALAWTFGRQQKARHTPYDTRGGANPDWDVGDDSAASISPGSQGANAPTGGHYRGTIGSVDVASVDAGDEALPRVVKLNDAWVFILPDGTVTIRDGHASCITMSKGHVTISASKDINLLAGRSVNIRGGDDINVNARKSLDLTAAKGQARLFSEKSLFVHSEDGGVQISTSGSSAGLSATGASGEDSEVSGVVVAPHKDTDFVVRARSTYFRNSDFFFSGGPASDEPGVGATVSKVPHTMFEADQVLTKAKGSIVWRGGDDPDSAGTMRLGSGETPLWVSGSLQVEGDLQAPLGGVKIHEEEVSTCVYPGEGWLSLKEVGQVVFDGVVPGGSYSIQTRNAAREECDGEPDNTSPDWGLQGGSPLDWEQDIAPASAPRTRLEQLEFSFRDEGDYGTDSDDFTICEQPWMREWSGAVQWGDDARAKSAAGGMTYAYPGRKYWAGGTGYMSYREGNVSPGGDPMSRSGLRSNLTGNITVSGLKSCRRHPDV